LHHFFEEYTLLRRRGDFGLGLSFGMATRGMEEGLVDLQDSQ